MRVHSDRRPPTLYRFASPAGGPVRGRPAAGAIITLVALLGSLAAATLGPAAGEPLPSPLVLLLILIRG